MFPEIISQVEQIISEVIYIGILHYSKFCLTNLTYFFLLVINLYFYILHHRTQKLQHAASLN